LLIVFFLLSNFAAAQAASSGVGVGLSSNSITISGTLLDYYVSTLRVTNPSQYEIKVKIYFDCFDCTSDVKIFGKKIGEKTVDYRSFFNFDRDDITIAPFSLEKNAPAVKVIFSPKFFIKNELKLYTPEALNFFIKLLNKNYQNSFTLPYYSMFIGERKITGLVVADVYASSFGQMGVTPSVGSKLEMRARGMPLSSFILLLILAILIGILIYTKIKSRKSQKKKHGSQD